jgi:hypothetical protein
MGAHELYAPGIDLIDVRGDVGVEQKGGVHGPEAEVQKLLLPELACLAEHGQYPHAIVIYLPPPRMEGPPRAPGAAEGAVDQVGGACRDEQQQDGLDYVQEQELIHEFHTSTENDPYRYTKCSIIRKATEGQFFAPDIERHRYDTLFLVIARSPIDYPEVSR